MQPVVLYTRRQRLYDRFITMTRHEKSVRRFFEQKDMLRHGLKILDAGCGSGAVTKAIQSVANKQKLYDLTFYGFDATESMLNAFKTSKSNLPYPVELVKANVLTLKNDLPTHWSNFNLIVSAGMLEYLPETEIENALTALRQLLTANGKLVIFISRKSLFTFFTIQKLWQANVYTREALTHVLRATNFKIDSLEKFKSWGWAVIASPL